MQEIRLFCAFNTEFDAERLTTETNEFIQSVRAEGLTIQRVFAQQKIETVEGVSGLYALVTLHVQKPKQKQEVSE